MASVAEAQPEARSAFRRGVGQAGAVNLVRTRDLIDRVGVGLPYGDVERLARAAGFTLDQLADAIRVPRRTLSQRQRQGRLRPDESDRLVRLARLVSLATALFDDDPAAAGRWMARPAKALAGHTPLDYSRTEPGGREVEHLIGRLEHGVVV